MHSGLAILLFAFDPRKAYDRTLVKRNFLFDGFFSSAAAAIGSAALIEETHNGKLLEFDKLYPKLLCKGEV